MLNRMPGFIFWIKSIFVTFASQPIQFQMSQVSNLELCNLAYGGHEAMVKLRLGDEPKLVDKTDTSGRTALHWACVSRQFDIVKGLPYINVLEWKLNPIIHF